MKTPFNMKKTLERTNANKRKVGVQLRQKIVREHLKSHPCVECGESDIVVLDFDHIDPSTKEANISHLIYGATIKRLKKEMAKCQVLCVRCHRIKTHGSDWWRLKS